MLALPSPASSETTIRLARWADLTALASVRTRSWQHTYDGILAAEALKRITPARSRAVLVQSLAVGDKTRGIMLAQSEDGEFIGYASFGPRMRDGAVIGGEVFEIYMDPAHQGQGVGRKLLTHTVWELVNRRLSPVVIRVLARNPARRFYEALGATLVGQQQQRFAGRDVAVAVYAFKDALPLPVGG